MAVVLDKRPVPHQPGQGGPEEGEEHQDGETEADSNRSRPCGVGEHGRSAVRGVDGSVERFHRGPIPLR